MGETCGLKLIYQTHYERKICRLCQRIDAKNRRLTKMKADIQRWEAEGDRPATIERTRAILKSVQYDVEKLLQEHSQMDQGSNKRVRYEANTWRSTIIPGLQSFGTE